MLKALTVLGLFLACKEDVRPCEQHNELMFDPADLEEIDAELVGLLATLAAGDDG
jgi:hypothetical protein